MSHITHKELAEAWKRLSMPKRWQMTDEQKRELFAIAAKIADEKRK